MNTDIKPEMLRYAESVNRLRGLRKMVNTLSLDNPDSKVISMFILIAFDPNKMLYVKELIGIDKFEELTLCTDLSQFPNLIMNCGLFDQQIDASYASLYAMVDAWKSNMSSSGLDINNFLKACINALTEREDMLSGGEVVIDTNERQRLSLRFGIEL